MAATQILRRAIHTATTNMSAGAHGGAHGSKLNSK